MFGKIKSVLFVCIILFFSANLSADEGMWTFDNPPLKNLEKDYGFVPSAEWLETAQKAAVRVGNSSGAFVSADGLVITNQHVAMGQLQKMSTSSKDYVKDGFYSRTRSREIKCPDLELKVLVRLEDVTEKVLNAQNKAEEIARIEKRAYETTGLYSKVTNLYRGGKYQLQLFEKYTDVRLVMASEYQASMFGGKYDNYTYPRYALDFAFFRAYKDGKPLKVKHYFKWNGKGAAKDELIFVAGNPGTTNRSKTVAQLEYDKDLFLPDLLDSLYFFYNALSAYGEWGPAHARQVRTDAYYILNYIKRFTGWHGAIASKEVMAKKIEQEEDLRGAVKKDKNLKKSAGPAWRKIERVQKNKIKNHKKLVYYDIYSHGGADSYRMFNILNRSRLAKMARTIVLYASEIEKPNEKRFSEFGDAALESVKFKLFSPAPIYPELEKFVLQAAFHYLIDRLGADELYVKTVLKKTGSQFVAEFAHNLVNGTKLFDVNFRKKLIEGGKSAVDSSNDPMIVWMKRLDDIYRKTRKMHETEIKKEEAGEETKIAKARFAVYGTDTYPDANSTLRLAYGKIKGYESGTTLVPYKTTFYDLYGRAENFDGIEPFGLSKKIAKRKKYVDMSVPLNFVATTDTVGGNSGSPIFNKKLEYIGLLFDRNIEGLDRNYIYGDTSGRTVAVHSAAITEALKNIYGMRNIIAELTKK
jgi:hypothetical protein